MPWCTIGCWAAVFLAAADATGTTLSSVGHCKMATAYGKLLTPADRLRQVPWHFPCGSRQQPTHQHHPNKSRTAPAALSRTPILDDAPRHMGQDSHPLARTNAGGPCVVTLSAARCLEILQGIMDTCQVASHAVPGSSEAEASAGVAAAAGSSRNDAVVAVLEEVYDQMEEVFLSKRGYVIPRREQVQVGP